MSNSSLVCFVSGLLIGCGVTYIAIYLAHLLTMKEMEGYQNEGSD